MAAVELPQLIKIVWVSLAYLSCAVYILFALYGNWKLWRASNQAFVQKRGKIVLFGLNGTLILNMVALLLTLIVTHLHVGSSVAVGLTTHCLAVAAFWMSFFFFLLKSWFLYFNDCWTFYTLQAEWQSIINERLQSSENQNWFLANKNKYGSFWYVFKLAGVYQVVGISLGIIGLVVFHFKLFHLWIVFILISIPMLPQLVAYLVIVWKTTKIAVVDDDILLIHWENKMHCRTQLFFVVFSMASSAVYIPLGPYLGTLLVLPLQISICYYMHHVSSFGIYSKLYHRTSIESAEASMMKIMEFSSSRGYKRMTMWKVLPSEDALHLFMLHLSKEFSMEILLSLIEITQYQMYAMNEMIQMEIEFVENNNSRDCFAHHMPVSSIVAAESTDFKRKAFQLYRKYIMRGAEYEINLAWRVRRSFQSLLHDEQYLMERKDVGINDLYVLFDQAQSEMVTLLNFSFTRFKKRPQFEKVLALFEKETASSESP